MRDLLLQFGNKSSPLLLAAQGFERNKDFLHVPYLRKTYPSFLDEGFSTDFHEFLNVLKLLLSLNFSVRKTFIVCAQLSLRHWHNRSCIVPCT